MAGKPDHNIHTFPVKVLYGWYRKHKRDLPWRRTKDPYRIWLSEIILQQTRVSQGLPYYRKFLKKYSGVKSLARAQEREVLSLWQGLGYYSRARNLLHTARQVAALPGSRFPEEYNALRALKGIGEYTAAAIASFAYSLPYPAVDSNVLRVLARYFGIALPVNSPQGKNRFGELAEALIDRKEPGLFNQAMMEFGALQCVPVNPGCGKCPLRTGCQAFRENRVSEFPVKQRRSAVKSRFFNYLVFTKNNRLYLRKREGKDIWQGMYDFPLIESGRIMTDKEIMGRPEWENLVPASFTGKLIPSALHTQTLTHQRITARFWKAELGMRDLKKGHGLARILPGGLSRYPMPKLIICFLEDKSVSL